jgi:hypothetical protein
VEYELGNAPRLMRSGKYIIISVSGNYLSAGPVAVYNLAEREKRFVRYVPIFVAFLYADDGGVEFAI